MKKQIRIAVNSLSYYAGIAIVLLAVQVVQMPSDRHQSSLARNFQTADTLKPKLPQPFKPTQLPASPNLPDLPEIPKPDTKPTKPELPKSPESPKFPEKDMT